MGYKQSLLKKAKNILDTKINNSWLHNVYVLYFIFAIALGNAYYLMVSHDLYYLSIFVIIAFLTSFFSKNMIVILCITMAATNVLKFGVKATMEGFGEKNENAENTAEFVRKDKKVSLIEPESLVNYDNPTEESKKKDGFNGDNVYTNIDDMEINEVYDKKDKILQNQEKLLKNLNQYKPLLDTINSITKSVSNIKDVKSAATSIN